MNLFAQSNIKTTNTHTFDQSVKFPTHHLTVGNGLSTDESTIVASNYKWLNLENIIMEYQHHNVSVKWHSEHQISNILQGETRVAWFKFWHLKWLQFLAQGRRLCYLLMQFYCLSICCTDDPHLNGSKYRNVLHRVWQSAVSCFLMPNFVVMSFWDQPEQMCQSTPCQKQKFDQ